MSDSNEFARVFGRVFISFLLVACVPCEFAYAIEAIGKISVFPVLYSGERGEKIDSATVASLDDTWWQVREELTSEGRFLVASRAFLQKADAFQPRSKLSVGDAVVLGRYVEADALMTMSLKDRSFTISVFQSSDGTTLWSQTVELHPSILVREQIAKVARALCREFVAELPYQGVAIFDSISKRAIFKDGGVNRIRISLSTETIAVGDPVQLIEWRRANLDPLLQGGSVIEIAGEGRVSSIGERSAVVDLVRVVDASHIRAGSLVNLPKEQARLKKIAQPRDSVTSAAVISLLAAESAIEPEAKKVEHQNDESGPLATTLSILGSLAVILLLAF